MKLLSTCGTVPLNNMLFYWAKNINGLFSLNLSNGECKCHLQDDEERKSELLRYSTCIMVDERIIFAPYRSSRILMFDPKSEKYCYYPLNQPGEFSYLMEWRGWMYFWGTSGILRMGIKDGLFEKLDEFSDKNFVGNICLVDDCAYACAKEIGGIVEFDLNSNKAGIITILNNKQLFSVIFYADGLFLLGGNDGKIYKWRKGWLEIEEIPMEDEVRLNEDSEYSECYGGIKKIGDYVYFSPLRTESLIRVNLKDFHAETAFMINEDEIYGGFFDIDEERSGLIIEERGSYYRTSRELTISVNGDITEESVLFFVEGEEYVPGMYENDIDTLQQFICSV